MRQNSNDPYRNPSNPYFIGQSYSNNPYPQQPPFQNSQTLSNMGSNFYHSEYPQQQEPSIINGLSCLDGLDSEALMAPILLKAMNCLHENRRNGDFKEIEASVRENVKEIKERHSTLKKEWGQRIEEEENKL